MVPYDAHSGFHGRASRNARAVLIKILDELVTRLNRTIEDFNEEFQGIIGVLKDSSERRHQILHDLMEGNSVPTNTGKKPKTMDDQVSENSEEESPAAEMSDWEKKLEGLA